MDGPAPAGQQISIGVSVQRPNAAAEEALYSDINDPSSPEYEQFLTPAEFDQEFGVPAAESSAVSSWLQGAA